MQVARDRRSFLSLVVVTTLSGLGAACGVKGPLYFPTEEEIQKKKEREKEKEKEKEIEPVRF